MGDLETTVGRIEQKLTDFIEAHDKNDELYRDNHKDEHKRLWKIIFGIPATILVLIGIVKGILKAAGG
jgi:hypothetical protein